MASTYTVNLGIEKIGTGEQSGTWGTTTNTNFDLIDQAINGAVTVTLASAGTSGVPNTLAITDGAVSDGRNKFIDFADGGDLGAAAYVQLTPNDAEKLVHIRNSLSGGRSIFVFQGTYNASNDFEIPNGKDVVLKFDGGGATATVTQVFEDLLVTAVAATTVDTTNIEVTNLKAKDGTSAGSIADSTGVVTLASSVLTTTDINGGSVDGVTLGTNSAVTEAQIDNININGNTISSTDTNGNVTITPDGTGSVAISKIDVAGGEIDGTAIGANSASTAVFTDLTASGTVSFSGATVSDGGTVTTVNIDGGSIDGTIIGAATPAAGSFTTITASDDVNFDSGTFFVDASANAVGIGTTSPSSYFPGATNLVLSGTGDSGLTINSGTSGTSRLHFADGTSGDSRYRGYVVYSHISDSMQFATAGSERMRIDSAGNVGIGTASPRAVSGYNNLVLDGSTSGLFEINANGTRVVSLYASGNDINLVNPTATGTMQFYTNNTERMRIDASGNVTIGSTNAGNAGTLNLSVGLAGTTTGGVQLWSPTTGTHYVQFGDGTTGGDPYRGAVGYNHTDDALLMLAAGSERARITSGGSLYVGTSSGVISGATFGLEVKRALPAVFMADSTVTTPAYGGVIFYRPRDTAGNGNGIAFNLDDSSGDAAEYGYIGAIIEDDTAGTVDGSLLFAPSTNNVRVERMRIDSSGNVGLGVTPSAWATFNVFQASRGSVAATTGEVDVSHNAYFDGAWKYIANGFATNHYQSSGAYFWRTAGSGTAGTTISFSEVMRLDASGNLLVGTTTNPDSRKLRVYGISEIDGAGVGLQVFKSSGTKIGGAGQGDYVVSGGPSTGFGIQSESDLVFGSNGTNERMRIASDGAITATYNAATVFFGLGGVNTVNGVAGLPSNAGTPLALARDTGTLRSAHFAGNLKFDNGYGIDFGASSGGGATSTILDDYEEGTWTPTLTQTVSNPTITYSNNAGTYTKIGRLVYASGLIHWSALIAGSGAFEISGLPFTVINTAFGYPQFLSSDYDGVNFSANGATFGGYGLINATTIRLLIVSNNGGAGVNIPTPAVSGYIYFNLIYQV